MKKNYLFAFVLSFAILIFWDRFTAKPSLKTETDPVAVSSVDTAVSPTPSVLQESTLVYEIGLNRLSVNRYGGGIKQWEIRENDRWLSLVPEKGYARQPLTAFPEILFSVEQVGPSLKMTGTRSDGVTVEKTLTVSETDYRHTLDVRLVNTSSASLTVAYSLGWGFGVEAGDDLGEKSSKGTQRAIAYQPPRVIKLKPSVQTGAFPWWGVDGHYFLAAFLPTSDAIPSVTLQTEKQDAYFAVRQLLTVALEPGASKDDKFSLYLGPKGFETLKAVGFGLEKSVDFGFFAPVGRLIHVSLFSLYKVTHNFGWAILLMTCVIQVIVLPLTVKSFQHSQKMKDIQPQLKRIQELHKGDPRRLNAEMMDLYKRHGLRFMGMEGCVPMLIQLPIFWALYSALRSTFELRHAPWIGWVKDLSVHDPFYVLPVLMGAGMFFQQKMSMSSMDPNQRQIMYIMPIVFTFVFLKMPSGLVLYWFTNSLLTIGIQMWLLRRHNTVKAS